MARRTNRKKGSGGGFVLTLILVLLAIAVAGGIYYAASRDGEKDVLDKGLTGSSSVDLREESKEAHLFLRLCSPHNKCLQQQL